jgi:hypothetical protein
MRRILVGVVGFLLASGAVAAPLLWRFGIEDTWSQLGGLLTPQQKDGLTAKMAVLTASQLQGGDVNVNGLAGGWDGMQAAPGAPIDFSQSDALVRLLQAHRFSMLWNLRINADWASAGNADCYGTLPVANCAPDATHEDDLYDYIRAVVERYDGDGVDDMGSGTPDPSDDLTVPVRFYLMTGEIEFAGANSTDPATYGDAATSHFWTDTIPHLLTTHRIVRAAIRDADPSGATKLVSSGGVLWDLYSDFPDYPALTGPTVQARLAGTNNHGATYTQSFGRLVEMLSSFGDDSDGVEADYIGWHPHMGWREIPQAFALIRQYAPGKPIYVDDMWANLFLQSRADAPGYAQFTDGGAAIAGDFPSSLVPSYAVLKSNVPNNTNGVRDWYDARSARQLVKSFVAAFGEGAERVSFSGNADFALDRGVGVTGWINLLGSFGDTPSFPEKPAYYTYKLLVEKLNDFTCVNELAVASNPRTRVYRFERPRGPIWIGWSETAGAPPGLDYDVDNGQTVSFGVGTASLRRTKIVDTWGTATPQVSTLSTPSNSLSRQLGYEPLIVERNSNSLFADGFECGGVVGWSATKL